MTKHFFFVIMNTILFNFLHVWTLRMFFFAQHIFRPEASSDCLRTACKPWFAHRRWVCPKRASREEPTHPQDDCHRPASSYATSRCGSWCWWRCPPHWSPLTSHHPGPPRSFWVSAFLSFSLSCLHVKATQDDKNTIATTKNIHRQTDWGDLNLKKGLNH